MSDADRDEELLSSQPAVIRRTPSGASDASSKRGLPESPSQAEVTPKRPKVTRLGGGKESRDVSGVRPAEGTRLRLDPRGVDLSGRTLLEESEVSKVVAIESNVVRGVVLGIADYAYTSLAL